jgi:outer membrane protein OmpA-like peptidoglycan-associated protein
MKTRSNIHIRPRIALAVCAALCGVSTAARAADAPASTRASPQESTGVASGLLIGAAAGGPFGAMVGAATGAWLGDRLHREHTGRLHAEGDLAAARDGGHGLETQVLFRTGDDQLRASDLELLQRFATLVKGLPQAQVRVAGYADPRGDAEYNAQLSARRAAAVAAQLLACGVTPDRVQVEAHGAHPALAAKAGAGTAPDLDGYAFERRVQLRIETGAATRTTTPAAVARRD